MSNMTKIAVLDDWQGVARGSADWSGLQARAEVTFFADAFADENDAAAKLADFDIVLSMRERTPLPGSLINRLPKLRMMGMTGARNASLDTPACTARGIVVCNTGSDHSNATTAELALALLFAAARHVGAMSTTSQCSESMRRSARATVVLPRPAPPVSAYMPGVRRASRSVWRASDWSGDGCQPASASSATRVSASQKSGGSPRAGSTAATGTTPCAHRIPRPR